MEKEEFNEILWGDNPDYKMVTEVSIDDQSRWSIYKSVIVQQISSGKYFEASWGEGATEYQEGQDEPWSLVEVEPYEETVIFYRQVKGGICYE